MKKIKIELIALIVAVGLGLSGMAMAKLFLKEGKGASQREYVPDEIIVKFKKDSKPFRVIKIPKGKVEEKIKEYLKRTDVIYAEPNYYVYALMVPNDEYYSYQWHLNNPEYDGIHMEKAWDISTGDSSVIVAIVDTGIAYEDYREGWRRYCQAPDLAQTCFVPGYDFVNNDAHPNDDNGHGTHVAGTVAQSTNNSIGVAGIAFNTCLMPVKVLDRKGRGTYASVAEGIRWAVDHGAKVINLSLGGPEDSETLKDSVKYAYENGVTVIAAAGNDNSSTLSYPAAYDDYVIAVGATQYDETLAPYSNYGPSLDLVAPGGNNSLDQNNDGYVDGILQQTFKSSWLVCNFGYYFFAGTSMAAPHVSGVAALLIANGNATTPDEIRNALQETAEDKGEPGKDDIYGWGLVNAWNALSWQAGPACLVDTDCDDANECTNDVCINPGTTNAYCENKSVADDTLCSEGICCNGICTPLTCSVNEDCSDNNICTIDVCINPGTCSAACTYEEITTCSGTVSDGCCPAGCTFETDTDCPTTTICWSKDYQYLYLNGNQFKKFCKCAQGNYGYNSYRYNFGRKTVYYYTDSKDNENWEVESRVFYLPVYEVICTDGKGYLTNQDYFYPK
jgi:serine protease